MTILRLQLRWFQADILENTKQVRSFMDLKMLRQHCISCGYTEKKRSCFNSRWSRACNFRKRQILVRSTGNMLTKRLLKSIGKDCTSGEILARI